MRTAAAVVRSLGLRGWLRPFAAAAIAGVVAPLLWWATIHGWLESARGLLLALPGAGAVVGALASARAAWRDSELTRRRLLALRDQAIEQRDRLDTAIDLARTEVSAYDLMSRGGYDLTS